MILAAIDPDLLMEYENTGRSIQGRADSLLMHCSLFKQFKIKAAMSEEYYTSVFNEPPWNTHPTLRGQWQTFCDVVYATLANQEIIAYSSTNEIRVEPDYTCMCARSSMEDAWRRLLVGCIGTAATYIAGFDDICGMDRRLRVTEMNPKTLAVIIDEYLEILTRRSDWIDRLPVDMNFLPRKALPTERQGIDISPHDNPRGLLQFCDSIYYGFDYVTRIDSFEQTHIANPEFRLHQINEDEFIIVTFCDTVLGVKLRIRTTADIDDDELSSYRRRVVIDHINQNLRR